MSVQKQMLNRGISDSKEGEGREAGQSFVELALSIVFILVLLAGVVDLGRMFFVFVTLRDAAQEGASYASFCPADIDGIIARVRNSSTAPVNLSDSTNVTIVILPDCSNAVNASVCEVGDPVTVRVSSPTFAMTMPFLGGVTIPLDSSVDDTILSNTLSCPP